MKFQFKYIICSQHNISQNVIHKMASILFRPRCVIFPLQWCHNDHDCVSTHQPGGCLLNPLFRHRSKKTSKLRVTGLCVGNSPGPVNSPHKWPVTRKVFPFDEVIMHWFSMGVISLCFSCYVYIHTENCIQNHHHGKMNPPITMELMGCWPPGAPFTDMDWL